MDGLAAAVNDTTKARWQGHTGNEFFKLSPSLCSSDLLFEDVSQLLSSVAVVFVGLKTMNDDEGIDFRKLEKELALAVEADAKYDRENSAKFRAVEQRVASYEEFRDIVSAAHLKPLERKDITG